MNKIRQIFMALAFFAAAIVPIGAGSGVVLAANDINTGGYACGGTEANQFKNANCDQNGDKLPQVLTMIINIFSWIVGVVSVIMIIYGGFRYITSGGESSGVKAAKDTILYAVIGLVIVALSQVIVQFVLTKANGAVN